MTKPATNTTLTADPPADLSELVGRCKTALSSLPAFVTELKPGTRGSSTVTLNAEAVAVLTSTVPNLSRELESVPAAKRDAAVSRLMEDPQAFLQRIRDDAWNKALAAGIDFLGSAETDPVKAEASYQAFCQYLNTVSAAEQDATNVQIEDAFGHDPDEVLHGVGGRAVNAVADTMLKTADAIGAALNDTGASIRTLDQSALQPFLTSEFARVDALISLLTTRGLDRPQTKE